MVFSLYDIIYVVEIEKSTEFKENQYQYISALKIDYKFEYTLDQGNTEVDSKRISQCLGMFESSMLRKCANIPLRN